MDGVGYEAHLKSTHGADTDARLENINELKVCSPRIAVEAIPINLVADLRGAGRRN